MLYETRGKVALDDQNSQDDAFSDPEPFEVKAAGQKLVLYPRGEDRREAMLELVRSAKQSLKVCFYIFATQGVGIELRDAVVEAAKRGVNVVVIVDSFGAEATADFFEDLTNAGGHFVCFSPRVSLRYLIRNHQKMIIADEERAMFGGFNIEDDYFAPPECNGWNDLAIALDGEAVAGLTEWFDTLYDRVADNRPGLKDISRAVRQWDWQRGGLRWVIGGPTKGLSSWASCVRQDLRKAKCLDMFMAYFSPPKSLLKCIGQIGQTGEVRLLMAAKSDNNATLGATRSLYSYLLERGVKIWEFSPCKLHTKLIVIDDAVYFGSANFDMRSLYVNLELMLRIEDADLADRMRDFISGHIAHSEAITPETHRRNATLWNRIRWNLGWLLVSVIDYNVSRRLNLGL